MDYLPADLQFIKPGQTWAIVGDSDSGHGDALRSISAKGIELVSFKHHFRNLSNTSDFYYQQRFNSYDAEDAQTVHEYLIAQQSIVPNSYWNYGKVVRELHLQDLLSEQVIMLSNGETKRLMIAAALVRNPFMLLLDHPLTGLDKQTRVTFSRILEHIIDSGITVIIATNPGEIPSSVSHVAVMNNRKVIFADRISVFEKQGFRFEASKPHDHELLKKLITSQQYPRFDTIIRMLDVNITYDSRHILRRLSWHVKQGERWSVSGPNGSGKSTLLSLVTGDNPQAYANNIVLFDRKRGSGESIWDIKQKIGFVSPELYQYFPTESSCLHVIESGFYDTVGLFRPSDPQKEKVCIEWMKLFGAEKYQSRLFNMVPVHVQRLCLLARALVKNPPLLILDEPTQGLDEAQQRFFVSLIDEICKLTPVTLVYVSHYEHHIPKAVAKELKLTKGGL